MAAVEENGDFTLTEAQLDRRWGGGGRGDHCEATDELGNAFSRWRARMTTATLGRKWGSCYGSALRAVKARERQMGLASASGRRWPSLGGRTRDVEALTEHERHVASGSYAGRP